MYVNTSDSQLSRIMFVILGFEFIVAAFGIPFQFPLIARYENTTGKMMINSLILPIAHLGVWFRMFFLWIIPAVLYYLSPGLRAYTWYLWLLFLTAFIAYVCSIFLQKFYDNLEHPEPQEKEED